MRAVYPGSFDPPHLGHLDIMRRAAKFCKELTIAVACNPAKQPLLPIEQRCRLLTLLTQEWPTVRVVHYMGATAHWAAAHGMRLIVRGIRGVSDVQHELAMAAVHRQFGLETIFLPADPALSWISSQLVREMLAARLDIGAAVPPQVAAALLEPGACR